MPVLLRFTLVVALCAGGLARAQIPADLFLQPVLAEPGQPWVGLRHAGDGSGRLFLIDRSGKLRIRQPGGGLLPVAFLRFTGSGGTLPPHGFSASGEGGLLGLAFHPGYAGNGRVYVHYIDGNNDNVVARYLRDAGNPDRLDPASVQVVLRVDADTGFHKGGDLHFGPDGYLYVAIGDGASGGNVGIDVCRRGQTLGPADLAANNGNHPDCPADSNFLQSGGNPDSRALQAKILRIDVDTTTAAGSNELCASDTDGAARYAIPPGNPFSGTAGGAGRCDETWAYGLRNPFRFSFDRLGGDLLLGDVGQGAKEEIDLIPAGSGGQNFGWPLCEGDQPGPVAGATCAGFEPPILVYSHQANGPPCSSVTGGFRYRGAIPGLRGRYVYTDYCTGRIHFAVPSGSGWTVEQSWPGGSFPEYTGFGEDEAGELYLTSLAGGVWRFQSATANQDPVFRSGFE